MKTRRKLKQVILSIVCGVISLFVVYPINTRANTKTVNIVVNDQKLVFNEDLGYPVTMEGRMYVPLRIMGEALGVHTKWNADNKSIVLQDEETIIKLVVNNPIATVDGKDIYIDRREGEPVVSTVPVVRGGRTYVPIRFITENLGCNIVFENGTTYITKAEKEAVEETEKIEVDSPISPWQYQALLGKGMDVDWSKTTAGQENYRVEAVKAFKAQGISHVRIRIKDEADENLFVHLDQQIKDCLENGLIPIIAYQADELKNEPTEKNMRKVVKWWGTVAERYQDYSHLLSFDLLIEVTDSLNKEPDKLNEIYERLVTEIRKTNPDRIIMISPRLRSDAAYLKELKIPTWHNNYLMAEWHFYASGPSKENDRKLWTVGTEKEKKLINDKINLALEWQAKTGIPTWVGAWMAGNYNDGNDYTVEEQVIFAKYMTEQLTKAQIPFAVNSDTKFYDREQNSWVTEMIPVRDVIWKS